MPRANVLINSLNAGEVGPLIESRSDLAKYATACKTLENAMPLVEGGAKKMPGTYFAGATALGGSIFTASISYSTLTVTSVTFGSIQIGQQVYIGEQALFYIIAAFGTGTGGVGTYVLSVPAPTHIPSQIMSTPSGGKSRLAPFQFSTGQGAVLEFSAGLIRIWEAATEGSWALGLAVNPPAATDYDPSTAYTIGDIVLLGPWVIIQSWKQVTISLPVWPYGATIWEPDTTKGVLYCATPYGSSNGNTVPITFTTNSSDALSVTVIGTSPNQGINIALANTTPGNNTAALIELAIRALGSLNAANSNYVDLSKWTVTPDTIYYTTPWIVAPPQAPPPYPVRPWQTTSESFTCAVDNQYDAFPAYSTSWTAGGSTPGGGAIELITPYAEADLFALDCSTQSADVLWIFHPNYPPGCVERFSGNSWKYSTSLPGQQPNEPPYRGTPDVVKTGASALGQSISLISQSSSAIFVLASIASSPPFANGDRVYINQCAGMPELNEGEYLVYGMTYGITGITVIDSTGDASTITMPAASWYMTLTDPTTGAPVNSANFQQYAGGGFAVKVIPMFAAPGDYPACGTLYEQRLFVGGSDNNPTRLYGSTEDDYPDFICDPNEDDYAVQYTLVANQVNQLLNMIGTPNGLAIGTSGGVWIVSSGAQSSLSQTNVNALIQSTQGVSPLQPQLVDGSAIFVSRSARIVTFLVYSFVTNQWNPIDLTRLNRNITVGTSAATSGLIQTAFQMEPYPIYWAVRNDGQLVGLVFNTQDQVFAWFRVNMVPYGGKVESVAVISGQNLEDEIAVVVNRTINGVTQRYFEYFMPQELFHQLPNAFFVHSGQQWQGVGPFAITGITNDIPAMVTAPGHTLQNGQSIAIADVLGMIEANTNPLVVWTVTGVSGDTFELDGIDSTGWGVYTSGGTVEQVTNQVTGMSYLLGETVVAVGDEQVMFNGIVTADTVVFLSYANFITIGIPYKTIIEPLNPIIGSRETTSKGKKQKVSRATLSMYESIGGKVGTDWNHLHAIDYGRNVPALPLVAEPPLLFTGNVTRDLDSDWTDEDTILIVHDQPYPFTLRSVTPRLSVAEEG